MLGKLNLKNASHPVPVKVCTCLTRLKMGLQCDSSYLNRQAMVFQLQVNLHASTTTERYWYSICGVCYIYNVIIFSLSHLVNIFLKH